MKYLFYDIETVPNEEVDWKPPEDKPDAFPPIPAHRIVSIAGMLMTIEEKNGPPLKNQVLWFGNFGDPKEGERSMILEFLEMLDEHGPTLVSYNGRGFDLPVIEHRCMRFGIQCPYLFEWNLRNRYKEQGHIDMQDMLSNFGASMRSQLAVICQAIGMPGKMDVDGSKVDELIQNGEQQTVDSYCLCDVGELAWLFVRWLHMKGDISKVTNHNAIHSIKAGMQQKYDEMVNQLIERTNIQRLSLEERDEQLAEAGKASILQEGDEEEDPDIPF